jgi:hypothetical protein
MRHGTESEEGHAGDAALSKRSQFTTNSWDVYR